MDHYFDSKLKQYLDLNVESETFCSLLSNWYESSIEYLKRTLLLLNGNASILFEEVAFHDVNSGDSLIIFTQF